jgi:hypothetical protein
LAGSIERTGRATLDGLADRSDGVTTSAFVVAGIGPAGGGVGLGALLGFALAFGEAFFEVPLRLAEVASELRYLRAAEDHEDDDQDDDPLGPGRHIASITTRPAPR